MDQPTKKCSLCPEGQNIKPITAFYKDATSKDGLASACIECRNARRKAKRDSDPEYRARLNAKTRAWAKANPEWIAQYEKDHATELRELRRRWFDDPDNQEAQRGYQKKHDKKRAPQKALDHQQRSADPAYVSRRRNATKQWRLTHPEQARVHVRTRRARKKNAPIVEAVDLDVLFERDKGICQLCHKRCKREDATNDHIIPLSEGGEHSYRNCVLAHFSCNVRKNNRHTIPQQQRLFG